MFGSQRPDRRKVVEVLHWLKLNAGDKFEAWLAGPGVGVHLHYERGSKACRAKLTDGSLECAYCNAGLKPTYRCYFPLYDRTGTKRVIAVNQDYDEAGLLLALHQAVLVRKLKVWGSPLSIEEDLKRDPWEPRNEVEARPLFIHEWLLQVWHDPEISKWVAAHPFHREQPSIAPRTEAKKKADKRLAEELAEKMDAKADTKETVNRVHEYMKKLTVKPGQEPSKNGKSHK